MNQWFIFFNVKTTVHCVFLSKRRGEGYINKQFFFKKKKINNMKRSLDESTSDTQYITQHLNTILKENLNLVGNTIIPIVFSPHHQMELARKHYETCGFVVFDGEGSIPHQHIDEHLKQVDEYLNITINNYHEQHTKRYINKKKTFPLIPNKFNMGRIVGTLYENSPNLNDSLAPPILMVEEEEGEANVDISPNDIVVDDNINQSENAWYLRGACAPIYAEFISLQMERLLSSVEDTTCVFHRNTPQSKLQNDVLHFHPKAFNVTEEQVKFPRGFLSLNTGSSFAIVPGFHTLFDKFKEEISHSGYLRKRTRTRATVPKKYEEDVKPFNILLSKGQLLLYDIRLPTKMSSDGVDAMTNVNDEEGVVSSSGTSTLPEERRNTHVGLCVAFFDPAPRKFSEYDFFTRKLAAVNNYVCNNDRLFDHFIFIKRRGLHFKLPGTFSPRYLRFMDQEGEEGGVKNSTVRGLIYGDWSPIVG